MPAAEFRSAFVPFKQRCTTRQSVTGEISQLQIIPNESSAKKTTLSLKSQPVIKFENTIVIKERPLLIV